MRTFFTPVLLAAIFTATVTPVPVLAQQQQQQQQQWPQWRGPALDGSSSARNLPAEWSSEKNVRWKTALPGWSGSTPIVWGEHIVLLSPTPAEESAPAPEAEAEPLGRGRRGRGPGRNPGGKELLLLCIASANGELLWERLLDEGNELHMKGNDSSPSPVTDGKLVWAMTGHGKVSAWNFAGDELWQRDLQADYGAFGLNWGYASSPLLHADLLIIQVLHGTHTDEPSYVLALDAQSGQTVWKVERVTDAPRESPDAYTTPLAVPIEGGSQIIVTGGDCITAHNPKDGKELWRVDGLNPRKAPNYRIVASPLYAAGFLIAPTRVRPLLALQLDKAGRPAESPVTWTFDEQGAPDVPTPTSDGRHLYLVTDNGLVSCLELASGKTLWGPERALEGTISASPLLADSKLFVTSEDGRTAVLRAGPSYELLATNELDGSYTLSSPIACGNRLYLRTEDFLYCIADATQ